MFYPRMIYRQLESEIATKEVVVITGMRQVGKTTALNHLFELIKSDNKVILDLEDPLKRKLFEEDSYDAIWNNLNQFGINNKKKAYIFIDEVQNLPEVSRAVKYLYDHWPVKFFLTGSSSYYLRNLFPESLAGRKIIFELFPMTFAEFLVFKQVKYKETKSFSGKIRNKNIISYSRLIPYYKEFSQFGGFPKVVLEQKHDRKKQLLSEIFTSYFEKDAKNLADFRDMSKLRDLILLLVPRIGSKIDIKKLASELSVSRETIYNYLSFLEQTYFISLLSKFSSSIDRQSAGSKKLFFCDNGIANTLGRLSEGQLFEQSVFQSLRPRYKLRFYSKENGQEIDFIVDAKIGLEVKYSSSRRDVANLKKRAGSLSIKENYLVSHQYSKEKEIIVATDL